MSVSSGALLAVVAWAALWDVMLLRIPNWLLLGGWLLGFGLSPGAEYVLKSIFPVAVLWTLWSIGIFGAGDLKLLAVICGYLSFGEWIEFFIYFILSAGGISLLRLILDSDLRIRFSYFFNYCKDVLERKQLILYEGPKKTQSSIPLAVPAFVGYLWLIW